MFYVTVHFWFELSTPVHVTFGVVPLSLTVMLSFLLYLSFALRVELATFQP